MFSVLIKNGRTKDMRSNIIVLVADPQFATPHSQQYSSPTKPTPIVLPRSIAIPEALPLLVRSIAIPALVHPPSWIVIPRGQEATIRAPGLLK